VTRHWPLSNAGFQPAISKSNYRLKACVTFKTQLKGTSKNWHIARDRRLWRAGIPLRPRATRGQEEQTPRAAPLRAVTGFATMAESIRICLPSGFAGMLRRDKSGCGSFWLKKECSSLGVSLDTPSSFAGKLRGTGRSEILFELSKISRPPRRTTCEFLEVP
jgi:hypothetical protein